MPEFTKKEIGVSQVVMDRFNSEWLPQIRAMKEKVDRGETLSDRELGLLDAANTEATNGLEFAKKHPEFQSLVDNAMRLYEYISTKNEANSASDP